MNIKNSKYKNIENTIVDVEVEHPKLGWIPYTFKNNEADESLDVEIREWLKTATIEDYIEPILTPEQEQENWKASRAEAVANIKVITTSGKTFDGDEISQNRMSRAISVIEDRETQLWVLANDISTTVTKSELIEALRLSGQAQTKLWIKEE